MVRKGCLLDVTFIWWRVEELEGLHQSRLKLDSLLHLSRDVLGFYSESEAQISFGLVHANDLHVFS